MNSSLFRVSRQEKAYQCPHRSLIPPLVEWCLSRKAIARRRRTNPVTAIDLRKKIMKEIQNAIAGQQIHALRAAP